MADMKRRTFLTGAAAGLAIAIAAAPAHAIDPRLRAAQKAGLIGERADGYLGFVDEADADDDLKRRVAEINARRREVYTLKSQETGESLSTIASLTAQRQIERTAPGEYYMDKYGAWRRK